MPQVERQCITAKQARSIEASWAMMKILAGSKEKFAIEISINGIEKDWIFGEFLFWFEKQIVGNPNDTVVHLNGCRNWLKSFGISKTNRVEQKLYEMDKEDLYSSLTETVLYYPKKKKLSEYQLDRLINEYGDILTRFHISHIGMSSFDRFTILLIENEHGQQRCIWQRDQDKIKEAFLASGTMEKVAIDAVEFFDLEILGLKGI